eukprot:TRINITY_DN3115_c0_g2_i7.p1 TRINITY_DN3115_c0_g2~~TRINITY_DN3115_c0_g2_i7.p1  ORF type:complete len:498 (-),score=46.47 TRINITY_DN3115_c0_g2_i7:493-1986(-)
MSDRKSVVQGKSVSVRVDLGGRRIIKKKKKKKNDSLLMLPLTELAGLLRNGKLTSTELTQIALRKMKELDVYLEMVITFTEDLAMQQAQQADNELSTGIDRGVLHGIPYGLKDIIAVKGYPTTWGATPFQYQYFDEDAVVYKRLREAGAVLVGKLTTGAMAYNDVWFGGKTKNPWNIDEGSCGSSAGSAAAVSAVTLPFAIGSETSGSLGCPADRVGITSLRPTFGTVARTGVMSLSPSLDKVGPMCRHAMDCAVVLDAISGKDSGDTGSVDVNLTDPYKIDITSIRLGVTPSADPEVVEVFRKLGVQIVSVISMEDLFAGYSIHNIRDIILLSEAAANFDDWLRTDKIMQMVERSEWPQRLFQARFIPAVEYVNANRLRSLIMTAIHDFFTMNDIDAVLGFWVDFISVGNLAGLPQMVFPVGFIPVEVDSNRMYVFSQTVMGPLWSDMTLSALADGFQGATDYHLRVPPVQNVENYILNRCDDLSRCTFLEESFTG